MRILSLNQYVRLAYVIWFSNILEVKTTKQLPVEIQDMIIDCVDEDLSDLQHQMQESIKSHKRELGRDLSGQLFGGNGCDCRVTLKRYCGH